MAPDLLTTAALILVLAVAARLVADRVGVPSVLFLIVAGVAIGPEGLGLVSRASFGSGLEAMVGVAVAIILFEGAFRLEADQLRETPTDLLRLVTIGAVVMWLGTTLAVRFALTVDGEPIGWDLALLIGALLIATGPTVITPILNVVTVRDHVAAAMESEGIVNDVTAAALAVVIFEVLVTGSHGPVAFLGSFATKLVVGVAVGALAAGGVWWLLEQGALPPGDAPLHARLVVLGGLLGSFAVAELAANESGIAAAATMGFGLGTVELPHRRAVEGFTEDLSTIVLGFVFVALAALIDFGHILALGAAGLVVVVLVTLVVRPFLIFASIRSERFTRGERLFMSFVAPRGIIPASVATLFAVHLETADAAAEAQTLAGTVFLIIFATVVFQAGLAPQIAKHLNVIPMCTLVIGGGQVGSVLATRLERSGENVVIVDADREVVDRLREEGHQVVHGNGTDADVLREAGAENAEAVVATTDVDDVNLLVCQHARTTFDVETVAARVNDADNLDAFEAIDVRAIGAGHATANALENVLERPTLASWMNEVGRTGDVREISITADALVGKTVAEVNAEIPEGVIVGLLSQGDETHAPTGDDVLEYGDRVTFIGRRDAVDRAVKRFHPHD